MNRAKLISELRAVARPQTPLLAATLWLLLCLRRGTLYELGSTAVTAGVDFLTYDGTPIDSLHLLNLIQLARPVVYGAAVLTTVAALATWRRRRVQLRLAWVGAASATFCTATTYLTARCLYGPPDILLCDPSLKRAMLYLPVVGLAAAFSVHHDALREGGVPRPSASLRCSLLLGLAVGVGAAFPCWLAGNLLPDNGYDEASLFPVLGAALAPIVLRPAFGALAFSAQGAHGRLVSSLLAPLAAPFVFLGARSVLARPLANILAGDDLLMLRWDGTWQGDTWRNALLVFCGCLVAPVIMAPSLSRLVERRRAVVDRVLGVAAPLAVLLGAALLGATLVRASHQPEPGGYIASLPRAGEMEDCSVMAARGERVRSIDLGVITIRRSCERWEKLDAIGPEGARSDRWKDAIRRFGSGALRFSRDEARATWFIRRRGHPLAVRDDGSRPDVSAARIARLLSPPREWIWLTATGLLLGAGALAWSLRLRAERRAHHLHDLDDRITGALALALAAVTLGMAPLLAAASAGLVF